MSLDPSPELPAPRKPREYTGWRALGCLALSVLGTAGLAFLVLNQVGGKIERVRQKGSAMMARALAEAIKQFEADYHELPAPYGPVGPVPQGSDQDTDSAPSRNFITIITILGGKEEPTTGAQNPNHLDYLEGIKPAKKSTRPGAVYGWMDGLISDPATGAYGVVDYKGKPYRIRLDTNHDETLNNPNPEQAAADRPTLKARVLVWSAGKDGDWNTWDDNLMSWD